MQNKGLVPPWADPNHFRQRGLGGEWVTWDWSEVDSVEAGYVCYVTVAVTTLHNTQETNIYQLKQNINNTTLSTLSGDQQEKMFFSPRVAFILLIIYSIRWFLYSFCGVFFYIFRTLKKIYSSETISGFEESQELPLKFEDIVDKYYDKMRPPRTGGKNDQILYIIT